MIPMTPVSLTWIKDGSIVYDTSRNNEVHTDQLTFVVVVDTWKLFYVSETESEYLSLRRKIDLGVNTK